MSWLGVTPYLTEDSVYAALGELAQFSGGTEVVFDYANPPHAIEDARVRDLHYELAERVAESGEPFRCYFDAPALRAAAGLILVAAVPRTGALAPLALLDPARRDGAGAAAGRLKPTAFAASCGAAFVIALALGLIATGVGPAFAAWVASAIGAAAMTLLASRRPDRRRRRRGAAMGRDRRMVQPSHGRPGALDEATCPLPRFRRPASGFALSIPCPCSASAAAVRPMRSRRGAS